MAYSHDRRPVVGILATVILLTACAHAAGAAIYRCASEDDVAYSDEPCGNNAEAVDVGKASESTGARLENERIRSIGKTLSDERQLRELDGKIKRQRRKLKTLTEQYHAQMEAIDNELIALSDQARYSTQPPYPQTRQAYQDKRRALKARKKRLKQQHRAAREQTQLTLKQLEKAQKELK